jgi:hypothetical protein
MNGYTDYMYRSWQGREKRMNVCTRRTMDDYYCATGVLERFSRCLDMCSASEFRLTWHQSLGRATRRDFADGPALYNPAWMVTLGYTRTSLAELRVTRSSWVWISVANILYGQVSDRSLCPCPYRRRNLTLVYTLSHIVHPRYAFVAFP